VRKLLEIEPRPHPGLEFAIAIALTAPPEINDLAGIQGFVPPPPYDEDASGWFEQGTHSPEVTIGTKAAAPCLVTSGR
jgi:hypothetical protein